MSDAELRALEQAYAAGMQDLRNLRDAVRDGDVDMARDIQELVRQMESLDPGRFVGNPGLVEELAGQILPNLEQIELQLRSQLDGETGMARSDVSLPVPEGYAEAVAEYFRRLSESQ